MNLTVEVISTGSKGNCYLLKNFANETLILDCGVSYDKILTAKTFKAENVKGVLVTHQHSDHSKSMKKLETTYDVVFFKETCDKKAIHLGSYIIYPFEVKHNVICHAFIIYDIISNKYIVYATDLEKLPKIKNIDFWILEANNDKDYMFDLAIKGVQNNNIGAKNHLSIQEITEYFSDIDIKKPNKILFCHISKVNMFKDSFKEFDKLKINYDIAEDNTIYKF